MAQVILKDIYKIFDDNVVAVDGFNLEIYDKEFVVLLGPSGCGKTTLLRMIAGLTDISKGELYISGKLVNDVQPKNRDIAMVFQNYALYPHMTVFHNMAFGLELRKYSKKDIQQKVDKAADILNIKELLLRKPKELSGGQQQRVALGRAIVRDPQVFLFDEPLSNLDSKLRIQMRREISKLRERLQATMIYVTHDQIEAMTMGDRIVVMKDGLTQQIDTPLKLYNSPQNKFVAGFIGSPTMNFIKGKIVKDNGMYFDEGILKIRIPDEHTVKLEKYVNREITFGIRPENISTTDFHQEFTDKVEVSLTVELVEPIGNEIFLYVTTGNNTMVARVAPQTQLKIGQEIKLVFDLAKVHFYDIETEELVKT